MDLPLCPAQNWSVCSSTWKLSVQEGRKALIYSQFVSMLHLIEKELKARGISYVYLDGSSQDREAAVNQFQEDPSTQLFLISLKPAASV